jgi:hypothetical protein
MGRKNIRRIGQWLAVLVTGMLAGSVIITPVGAHISTFNHLKAKHFYTKKAADAKFYAKADADAKFLDDTEGNASFINSNELETKIATGTDFLQTNSTTYVELPGASATVTVPAGQSSLIIASFTAESECAVGGGTGYCSVRILIGGLEANPGAGSEFHFDSFGSGSATDFSEAHAMTRSRGPLGPGTYAVQVQATVSAANTTFVLDDWHLTVQRVPA